MLKQNINANATTTQDYDTDTQVVVQTLDSDYMDILYAPTRNYVTSTDYSSALNLNASGHIHLAQAFQENWYPCIVGATDVNGNPARPQSQNIGGSGSTAYAFTCLKFDDEGTTLSTVDTNNTLSPSYNWYTPVSWPNSGESSPNHWNAFTASSAVPWNSGQIVQNSGGLLINVSISVDGAPVLSSCAPTSGQRASPETAPFMVGKQFSGANGFYMEDELNFGSGNYTAWLEPTEQLDHQVGSPGTWPYRAFVEVDNPDSGTNEQDALLHASEDGATGPTIVGISNGGVHPVSGDIYGQLWLASSKTSTGHTKGYYYINNSLNNEQSQDQYFDDTVEEHQCLMVNGSAGYTTTQRFFRFWQEPL